MRSKELVVGFPVRGEDVLLGIRNQAPWDCKLSGYGGNTNSEDENDPRKTQVRELREESGLITCPWLIEKRGEFVVVREGKEPQILHAYIIPHFMGKEVTTKEMSSPMWFPIKNVPAGLMIPGDEFWVYRMLCGEFMSGTIYRSADAEKLVRIELN